MYDLQSVHTAVYMHPCVLYRGRDFYSMLASSELALRLSYERFLLWLMLS